MGKKVKILDQLKKAVLPEAKLEITLETLSEICWDVVNLRCTAIEIKEGKILRLHPPKLTADQIRESEKGNGNIKITAFR